MGFILLRSVVADSALRQRLLQFSHARFGDFGVAQEKAGELLHLGNLLEARVGDLGAGQEKRGVILLFCKQIALSFGVLVYYQLYQLCKLCCYRD